jgi:gliding motility-associated-like protein
VVYILRVNIILFLSILAFKSKAQSSLYLDAPVKWVNVGDLDVAGDQLTVEALIHYTGVSVNIVSKHTNPADVNYLLRIGSFEITTTAGFANFGGVAAAGVTLVPNTTYHVAATYNGQFLRYYVNGCLTGEMPWTGNMVQNNLNTAIGQQSSCQCEQYIGYIDEVRIWNVARTQAQIAANMFDLPAPGAQVGLLAYYKFDGNYTNLQGNAAFNGTPVGGPAFQQIPYPYPSGLHQTVLSSNPICTGDANGTIDVLSSGAYLPHQYSLDGVNYGPASSFSNLPAGNYTVFTRPNNNNNCVVSTPIQIIDPTPIAPDLTTTDVSCFGANDGVASVNLSGGGGVPFQVQWSNGQTGTNATNLSPGNYTVTVTDSCALAGNELVVNGGFENGNTGFTTDYVYCTNCLSGSNDLPGGNYVVGTNANQHHGAFVGQAHGGSGNFMIINGSSAPNTNVWCQTVNVQPNTYYFFSTWVSSVVAAAPAELQFSANGVLLGPVLTAPNVVGVWTQFTSTWYSGANNVVTICIVNQNTAMGGNDFGIDDISFKPCLSCSETFNFTINEPDELLISTSKVDVTCNGGADGSAEVQTQGGTVPYTISWSTNPVQNTAQITNLSPGTYTVTVTDDNGCSANASETIQVLFDPQIVSVNATNLNCFGVNTGTININATGVNLQYSIDGGLTFQAGNSFANLPSGSYDIIVEDNGCQVFDNITVSSPPELTLVLNLTQVNCNAACNGVALAVPQGGTPPYSYGWSNNLAGQNDNQANNVCANPNYSIVITDFNGCTFTQNFAITEPPPIDIVSSNFTDETCPGECDASIRVIAPNASAFSITNNVSQQPDGIFNGLCAGTYTLLMTDANGCVFEEQFTLAPGPIVVANFTASQFVVSETNPLVEFTNFSTDALSYEWDFAGLETNLEENSSFSFNTVEPGIYPVCLIAFNENGCSDTACLNIQVKQDLFVYVPNTFTPNGDGINDVFYLICEACVTAKEYKLTLFDRWGKVVFEADDVLKGWDGIHKSGLKAPTGNYVWRIDFMLQDEIEVRTHMGHVLLLR